jgi:phospholipid/cholesterol/gamma-HCH transport system substrate-binding protein
MTTKAQKIRVGAFVVVTAVLLSVVLVVFGGLRFWEKHDTYNIVFAGSVMGLEAGATVHLNGMRIGRVDEVRSAPNDLTKVLVKITVKHKTPIHADTKAYLQFAGITGLKVIDLRDGTLTSPALPPGSIIVEGEGVLDKLEAQAKNIAEQSKQLMDRANVIVDNIVVVSDNIKAVTDPKRFEGITEIIDQSAATARNLAATTTTLQATSKTLDAMVIENRVTLKSSLVAVETASKSAASLMDVQVAGIVGKAGDFIAGLENLVRSNEGQLRSAVFDLRQASRNFKELSRDVRQRPSRLLFSTAPGERKLP